MLRSRTNASGLSDFYVCTSFMFGWPKKMFRVKYVEGSTMDAITTFFATQRRPEVKNTSHPARYVFIAKRSYAVGSSNARLSLFSPAFSAAQTFYIIYILFTKAVTYFFPSPSVSARIRYIRFFVPSVSLSPVLFLRRIKPNAIKPTTLDQR